jgi:hypothetical protein
MTPWTISIATGPNRAASSNGSPLGPSRPKARAAAWGWRAIRQHTRMTTPSTASEARRCGAVAAGSRNSSPSAPSAATPAPPSTIPVPANGK